LAVQDEEGEEEESIVHEDEEERGCVRWLEKRGGNHNTSAGSEEP
jgi:hypothetical protein